MLSRVAEESKGIIQKGGGMSGAAARTGNCNKKRIQER